MKYLVLCFSATGNNRFLAHRLARRLPGEVRELRPFTRATGLLYLATLLRIPVGTGVPDDEVRAADEVVVCGPIWGWLLLRRWRPRSGRRPAAASSPGQARLSDETLRGPLEERLESFVDRISRSRSTNP